MELADVTDSKSVGSNTVWVRVPPPAPNTEAPVGCLCVWLSQTGLEAGGTKRSCGAFCPAGERKQSGRAARSASKGRFERRVPPPAPNTEAPVGCLCVWLSRTGLEAGGNKTVLWSVLPGRARSTECKQRYADLCSTHLICCILRRQISRKLLFCRCRLIGSSDKARSMPYKSPPVFRDFPPYLPIRLRKRRNLAEKM